MTVTLGKARPYGHLRALLAGEIRAAMAREGLSGVRLGAIIGKSQPYISRRLSGRLAFDIDDLEVISRVLSVSPSELIAEATRRIDRSLVDKSENVTRIDRAEPDAVHEGVNPQYLSEERHLVAMLSQVSDPSPPVASPLVLLNAASDRAESDVTHRTTPNQTNHLLLTA